MSQKKLITYTIIILIISFILVLSIPRMPDGDSNELDLGEEIESNREFNPFEQSNSDSVEQEENNDDDTIDIRVIE